MPLREVFRGGARPVRQHLPELTAGPASTAALSSASRMRPSKAFRRSARSEGRLRLNALRKEPGELWELLMSSSPLQ
eukprot:CAMPEP_0180505760 /NCGR_PEP_ID=MMETSP1036_2-20121128/47560_1 /TAXON_ID=632150 /ORGANISM="Azadinium spinosum, Strain 3D9" /LENGTH=76 /DNA_ID=CAMNT_0022515521 /DNA_START=685 /DNA_END=914 /DNA_ORIENTATION=+